MTELEAYIQGTAEKLAKANTQKAMKAIWSEAYKQLKEVVGAKTGEKPTSHEVRNRVRRVRAATRARLQPERFKAHKTRLELLLSPSRLGAGIITADLETVEQSREKSRNALSRSVNETKHVQNFGLLLVQSEAILRTSFDWCELACALALVTGRRTIEVMKTARIQVLNDDSVLFSGQAKTKNKKPYPIPVLVNAKSVKKGLDRLRKIKPMQDIPNPKVNALVAMSMQRHVKDWLAMHVDTDVKVHDLRKMYARYCLQTVKGSRNYPTNERLFLQAILGHESTDIGLHYESFTLSF